MPPFHFLLSADLTPVAPTTPLWKAPLPTSRVSAGGLSSEDAAQEGPRITYGAYFSALENALSADRCAVLCEALAALTKGPIAADRIESVEIQLLKHGHFYHPACVVARVAGVAHRLALNIALSPDGMALLPKETEALGALARQAGVTSVPRVLAMGACAHDGDRDWPWFLTPWFEGFHEFHLTRLDDGREVVTVWDQTPGPSALNPAQTNALLAGAARILTSAFDPHSLAHIFPWHHAAGDFVVRLDDDGHPRVRLITVRDYQPLLPRQAEDDTEADAFLERLLYALLLLVVQAALRLRVDRLDGVGEIAVHPVSVVSAICSGCLDGIGRMCRRWNLPADLDLAARAYLAAPSLDELNQLNSVVYGGFALGSPEREALAPHVKAHVNALHAHLQGGASTPSSH